MKASTLQICRSRTSLFCSFLSSCPLRKLRYVSFESSDVSTNMISRSAMRRLWSLNPVLLIAERTWTNAACL
jgi:hypothetical protein